MNRYLRLNRKLLMRITKSKKFRKMKMLKKRTQIKEIRSQIKRKLR